jgi:DNA-binding response OmpR family regulator
MKKVLIIDDALESRQIVRKLLRNYDLEILEANDGNEGWKTIVRERPDLVLLDLHMPDKDGFEILKDLEEEWLGIPVVVISGDHTQVAIDSALMYGARAYLQKPILLKEFKEAIKVINV